MLILTRRVGEALKLGEDITVTVLGVRGNQVRIGIDAPKSVAIQREEIYSTTVTDRTPEIGASYQTSRTNDEPCCSFNYRFSSRLWYSGLSELNGRRRRRFVPTTSS